MSSFIAVYLLGSSAVSTPSKLENSNSEKSGNANTLTLPFPPFTDFCNAFLTALNTLFYQVIIISC